MHTNQHTLKNRIYYWVVDSRKLKWILNVYDYRAITKAVGWSSVVRVEHVLSFTQQQTQNKRQKNDA